MFAACGIDESGTAPGDGSVDVGNQPDTGMPDTGGSKDVVSEPVSIPSCDGGLADASCIPALPSGWVPVAIQNGQGVACGDDGGSFASQQFVTNPMLTGTSCNCTNCVTIGSWTCGVLEQAGANCSSGTETNMATSSGCWNPTTSHGSFGGVLRRAGSVACSGGQEIGDQDASATPVSMCSPSTCSADYCGLQNSGFTLCVASTTVTDGTPPNSSFPNCQVLGTSAYATCASCQTCGLMNPNAQCSGELIAYGGGNCTGTDVGTDIPTEAGTCNTAPTGNLSSMYWDAGPTPTPNCGGTGGNPGGTPGLTSPFTVCCP